MKILFVIPYFFPAEFFGGPVNAAFDISKKLVERGNEVRVFTSDAKDLDNRLSMTSSSFSGVSVRYLRNISMLPVKWSKLCITPDLNKQLKESLHDFDIIHAHEYTTYQNIIVHKFAKKHDVPYVLQAHGSLPIIGRQGRKWFFDVVFGSNLLKDASQVIALNRMEVQHYLEVGLSADKISVVPNGIDLDQYTDLPSKGCFKKGIGLDENTRVVLFLGRLNKIKGLDTLVHAFKQTLERCSDAVLVIAGPDDGYRSELCKLINSLNITDSVLLVGPLYGKDKLSAYVDADVFVLPSVYETFPVSVLEAYACSRPVIASSFGSLDELVLDDVTGLLVKVGSADGLSEAILKLIKDPKKANEMGLMGKQLVQENYSTTKAAEMLEHLYSTIA